MVAIGILFGVAMLLASIFGVLDSGILLTCLAGIVVCFILAVHAANELGKRGHLMTDVFVHLKKST